MAKMRLTYWIAKKVRKAIIKFMRFTYKDGDQAIALRWIMETVFDELQDRFPEDNEVTTLAFMVSETLRASGISKDAIMYKKLSDIVD